MQSKKKDPVNPKVQAAIDLLLESGADLSTIFAQDGLLKVLTKNIVERALASEMEDHLGYSKRERCTTLTVCQISYRRPTESAIQAETFASTYLFCSLPY